MSSVAEPSSSASGSPSKERVEVMSKAVNLMGQGKRNLICGDVPMAVTQFEESCQILAKCYGEMAFECAAAYFSYGHALLELARLDSKVIESLEAEAAAAEEEENDDDDDDDEEEEEDGENEKSEKDSEKDGAASKDDEGTGDDRTDNSESLSSQDEAIEKQEKPEEKDPDEDEHDAGNDVTNLQLAWESLELAKIIYLKRKDKESQLKAAQAYLKLGEVGLETGLYDQAVEDIKECLKIQKEHLTPEEREIAETYYQLGLVHVFASNHDSAVENFKAAVSVIEAKIDKLNKSIEHLKDSTETSDVETVYNARTEIKELEEIVPDISQKITDTIEEKKTVADLKAFAKKEAAEKMMSSSLMGASSSTGFGGPSSSTSGVSGGGSSSSAGVSSNISGDVLGSTTGFSSILPVDPKTSTQPVKTTDISHLVRRKRKPDTEESSEEKKQKPDSSVDNTVSLTSSSSTSSSSKAEQKDSNSDPPKQ